MGVIDRRTVDRTNLHRIWKAVLVGIALIVATACYFVPVLFVAIGLLLLLILCARFAYQDRDRYIPNLYARDIRAYDDAYGAFIGRTLSDLRRCKIRGHTLLWEASRLAGPCVEDSDELLLDLGVWIGWSTRLISDACDRTVYGFDTFSGLVEDWQLEDLVVLKRGMFSVSDPFAQRFMRDTGVSFHDGLPAALGRKVQFIRGSTYDTLAPFLADRPAASIRLFHMDLDTYESCLHALETCKDHFIEGSILVFDEYLVTSGEMRAFYEFQSQLRTGMAIPGLGPRDHGDECRDDRCALEARDVLRSRDCIVLVERGRSLRMEMLSQAFLAILVGRTDRRYSFHAWCCRATEIG